MDGFERAANEKAAIALMQAGNYRGAEARLRNMLTANADDARALALLARCRFADKAGKEGLEIARSAANMDPDDLLVRSTLTYALQQAGKGKEARDEQLKLAEDAAADNPEDSDAIYNLAVARLNSNEYRKAKGRKQMDQFVIARDLMDDAERFASDFYELINIAYLRLDQWDYDAAADLAQRAMQLDPTRPDSFRILAECAIVQKRPLDAYELALEALRLSPGDKTIMRLLIRARARRNALLRPFLPGVDWIVEMDRRGLVILPLLMLGLGVVFSVALLQEVRRVEAGEAPAIVVALPLGLALLYAVICYLTAIRVRMRIRRDLRRVALPNF